MKFKVGELQDIISKNRDEHNKIFLEAMAGYTSKVKGDLQAYLERIERGEVIRVQIYYPEPENHTRDYDRILKMLDLTTEKSIELSEKQFESYVLDDWAWKRAFLTSNSAYSVTAARLSQDDEGFLYGN
jgi:hypothetical protein